MIRKLKPYLKGYGKYALLCCLCMIGEAVLELCMPFLMAKIVELHGFRQRQVWVLVHS